MGGACPPVASLPVIEADVVVVGAGPAGASAAIHAVRAGMRVILIDKATFPRDKCCGDGLTAAALRELEMLGLRPSDVTSWQPVDRVQVRSTRGRQTDLTLPQGRGLYAVVARRIDLDAALVAHAADAGVDVQTGHALTSVSTASDGVRCEVEGLGQLRARHLVAADGMWSPVRRLLGLAEVGYRGEWHALRQYVSGVTGAGTHTLAVWFEADLLPGYAWSFPLPDGTANIGLCVLRGERLDGAALAATWESLLDRTHVRAHLGPDAQPEAARKAWPIPARIDRSIRADGRVLFVGDAVGAPDLLTGEGIGQALLTGRLAAEAIASGSGNPLHAGIRYAHSVDAHLVADHRMSALLGRALSHRKGVEAAVRLVDASAWGRRNFARWLFEDEPRAALCTPRRWHRSFLARDGAYTPPSHVS